MTRKQRAVNKVLKLKGFTEEQLKAEVGKARDAFNHEQEKLDCLEEEMRVHLDEFSRKQGHSAIGVREIDLFYMYVEHLGKLIAQQKKCVQVRLSEMEEKQKEMHEAHKEQRLMEILHDRIVNDELLETIHADQKEADYQFLVRRAAR